MYKKDLVSIIAPIYNVNKFLNDFINSIKAQTYTNLEIILVDDGSTDGSAKTIDDFAKIDNRVKAIHKQNGGVSSARNLGLQNATGEYIYFADSDDVLHKDIILKLFNAIKKGNYDVSICRFSKISQNKKVRKFKELRKISKSKDYFGQDNVMCLLIANVYIWYPFNKLLKHDLIKKIKTYPDPFPYHCHFGEDCYFNLNYFAQCKSAIVIKDKLYYYRTNRGSITHSKFKNEKFTFYEQEKYLMTLDKNIYKETQLYIKAKSFLDSLIILYLFSYSSLKNKEQANFVWKLYKDTRKDFIKAKRYPFIWRHFLPHITWFSYLSILRKL